MPIQNKVSGVRPTSLLVGAVGGALLASWVWSGWIPALLGAVVGFVLVAVTSGGREQ